MIFRPTYLVIKGKWLTLLENFDRFPLLQLFDIPFKLVIFILTRFALHLQRFTASKDHLISTSESIHSYLDKLLDESKRLESHATQLDDVQTKCITEFRKSYEVSLS